MTARRPVVVGIDGSGGEAAVRWAVQEAGSRKVPVRLLCAYRTVPGYYQGRGRYTEAPIDLAQVRQVAEVVIEKAIIEAAVIDPKVEVDGQLVDGSPVPVLIEESRWGSLIVLGSRQRSALRSNILGSVSAAVAARAECPAVVLRGPAALSEEHPAIVVGVDGTLASQTLLEFGFDYASRRQVPLRAVLCWHPDLLATMMWRLEPPAPTRAEAWLAETLAGWQEKYPDVAVQSGVVREHPGAALAAESASAQLLVVGNRGRYAMAGTLLGSVSQAVLHHATCPVAVVPTHLV
ncbi:MAG TPA: universal stress protein [Jatrophihabitans sp.]|jgi:nucleotide-binding universal stress UspA family protein|uniref:universal stress protein n=1 Tax=Jatrophihabitans sp. TaxID=1932789 RepID=UPI002F03138C